MIYAFSGPQQLYERCRCIYFYIHCNAIYHLDGNKDKNSKSSIYFVYTIFHSADLNGGSRNALSTKWFGRQTNMVDSVRTEVRQKVGADRGTDGDMYASPL